MFKLEKSECPKCSNPLEGDFSGRLWGSARMIFACKLICPEETCTFDKEYTTTLD